MVSQKKLLVFCCKSFGVEENFLWIEHNLGIKKKKISLNKDQSPAELKISLLRYQTDGKQSNLQTNLCT